MEDTQKFDDAIASAISGQSTPVADNLIDCPCCGQHTLHTPVKAPRELIDIYLGCMVTGELFAYDYKLYGGSLTIRVSQLSPEVYRKLLRLMTILDGYGKTVPGMIDAISSIRYAINTFAPIIEISVGDNVFMPSMVIESVAESLLTLNDSTDRDADKICEALTSAYNLLKDPATISSVPNNILHTLVQLHNKLAIQLEDIGFDSDFWSRIKLA